MSSIFAALTQATIAIPFDVPHTVTIQRLTGQQLEEARLESQVRSVEALRRMGGAAFQRELAAAHAAADAEKSAADKAAAVETPDPLNLYDAATLLRYGIKAWSYVDDDKKPVPVTAAQVEGLSAEACEFLSGQILRLTRPDLFQTEAEVAAARKNV